LTKAVKMSPQGPTELKVDRTDGAVEALVVVVGVEVDAVKVVAFDEAKKRKVLKILLKKVPFILSMY
jgi:hypothetical protein